MIKAVVFDLNGILVQSPLLSERFEKDFGVPASEFVPVLSEIMERVRRPGAGHFFEYWKPAFKRWDLQLSGKDFEDYWFNAETLNREMLDYALSLKGRLRVFVLSNNFRERAAYYDQTFPELRKLGKIYYSWETGSVKPDARCFTRLLEDNHLRAEECYYFDDSDKNVEAAKRLGFSAHKFGGLEHVRRVISA